MPNSSSWLCNLFWTEAFLSHFVPLGKSFQTCNANTLIRKNKHILSLWCRNSWALRGPLTNKYLALLPLLSQKVTFGQCHDYQCGKLAFGKKTTIIQSHGATFVENSSISLKQMRVEAIFSEASLLDPIWSRKIKPNNRNRIKKLLKPGFMTQPLME